MLFSSFSFLCFFLPVVFMVYYLLPIKARNLFLLTASLCFYTWSVPKHVVIMIGVILIVYAAALGIGKKGIRSQIIFGLAVLSIVGILFFFKYVDFAISSINSVFKRQFPLWSIILPVGISFYSFQALSYLIDVRRGMPAQKSLLRLALYISLFPQLIAGPIVRYGTIYHQLSKRTHNISKIYAGFRRFIIGLAKKVLVADMLGVSVDKIFSVSPFELSPLVAWIGIIFYMLQIYFDFSGYSDMAIGLGRMFGFKFPENFNYPYVSASLTEFWRRWHMTLSGWFKSYVYIPLGGNRSGKVRTLINLAIVFFLTGIWHGAAWNFVIWGLWHGFFVILEKVLFMLHLPKNRFIVMIGHVYTLLVVLIGWVVFRSETWGYAKNYLFVMFGLIESDPNYLLPYYVRPGQWLIVEFALLGAFGVGKHLLHKRPPLWNVCIDLYLWMLLIGVVIVMTAAGYHPFIYFQF